MKKDKILLLVAEINKCREQLQKLNDYYKEIKKDFLALKDKKNYELVILADLFADYYTCLETVFVRISKFFENNLEKSKWHLDLLDKMTLEVPGVRKKVLQNKTYDALKEILRFRHFKRYYFDFDYDKDRIEFLEKKYLESYLYITKDLNNYKNFLYELSEKL